MLKLLAIASFILIPTLVGARWIEDLVSMPNEATGSVQFSHYRHLEALGNDCVLCHNRLFHIDVDKNQPVSMAEMEQGKSCGSCHNGEKAFSVTDNCSSCHPTRPISFSTEAGEALFSHELHTGIYGCSDCHPSLFAADSERNPPVSMGQMEQGESCGACHDGDTAFSVEENCEACHQM